MKASRQEKDKKWTNFKDDLKFLKDNVDARYLVESLGFSIDKETSRELRGTCLVHGGDNKSSFRYNKDKNTWVCFSHKCHEVFGNDVIGLIKAVMNVDFIGAVDYLKTIVGDITLNDEVRVEYKRKKERESFVSIYSKKRKKPAMVSEENLELYKPFRSKFFEKDFNKSTLDFFEVSGGYADSYGIVRDIIPIRDVDGELAAYSLRDIRDTALESDFKYILTSPFDKDKVLYNLNNAAPYGKVGPLIIVEGFKSVWKLHQVGVPNVVAIMGSQLTEGQINLLYSHALHGIVLMLDNDEAGMVGTANAFDAVSGKMDVSSIFITEVDENGKGCDPADISERSLIEYVKGYI